VLGVVEPTARQGGLQAAGGGWSQPRGLHHHLLWVVCCCAFAVHWHESPLPPTNPNPNPTAHQTLNPSTPGTHSWADRPPWYALALYFPFTTAAAALAPLLVLLLLRCAVRARTARMLRAAIAWAGAAGLVAVGSV